jgi:RNA polymerase-associated protein LEO1
MVRWDDGTYSLLIGEEFYEVAVNDMSKQHQYLLMSHEGQGVFQSLLHFDKYITFRPHSTLSLAHKKLTMAM